MRSLTIATLYLGAAALVAAFGTTATTAQRLHADTQPLPPQRKSMTNTHEDLFGGGMESPYYGDAARARRRGGKGVGNKDAPLRKLRVGKDGSLHDDAGDDGPNPQQPANPVVAMVASTMPDCTKYLDPSTPELHPPAGFTPTGCVTDLYTRWLQAQGVRVVVMNAAWPDAKKKALMDQVNGVMMLGGGLDGDDRVSYVNDVAYVLEYALARPGFLLWGTCQGFQVIGILLMQDFSVLTCDYEGMVPSMLPLEFTPYQPHSTLVGLEAARLGVLYTLQTKNSTLNWHSCGITPANFKPKLADAKIISNNADVNGKPFVSSYEITDGGKNIFAVQFHPERPALQYSNNSIGHDRDTLDANTYFARFLAQRLQLNNHQFSSQEALNNVTIDNYPHRNTGWGLGFYWINI